MREGTYPPQRVPEHCRQPQSWELGAPCMDVALVWLLWGSPVLGKDSLCHPLPPSLGDRARDGRESSHCCLNKVSVGVPLIKYSPDSGLYLLITLHHQVFPSTPCPLCPR